MMEEKEIESFHLFTSSLPPFSAITGNYAGALVGSINEMLIDGAQKNNEDSVSQLKEDDTQKRNDFKIKQYTDL